MSFQDGENRNCLPLPEPIHRKKIAVNLPAPQRGPGCSEFATLWLPWQPRGFSPTQASCSCHRFPLYSLRPLCAKACASPRHTEELGHSWVQREHGGDWRLDCTLTAHARAHTHTLWTPEHRHVNNQGIRKCGGVGGGRGTKVMKHGSGYNSRGKGGDACGWGTPWCHPFGSPCSSYLPPHNKLPPKLSRLKQQTLVISQFLRVRHPGASQAGGFRLTASPGVAVQLSSGPQSLEGLECLRPSTLTRLLAGDLSFSSHHKASPQSE